MGLGVARSLKRAGFAVHGCDVREEAVQLFASEGGTACHSPADLGARCEVVMVLVVNAEQTEQVLLGPGGAAPTMKPGSVVIASATCHPDFVRTLCDQLSAKGIELLDAPVSGGAVGAANGTLALMTSGPDATYQKCEDVLAAISSRVFRFGDVVGLGSKVKIINQLLVGVHVAAAAEAMALGIREGIAPELLYEVIVASAGNSWAFQDRVPRIVAGDFTAMTALDIFVKDLALVLDTARSSKFPLPLASTAYQMFASAACAGYGREDDSAVIKSFPGITLPQFRA
jgi:3-hydroxyisobutyrate dehydrogenase